MENILLTFDETTKKDILEIFNFGVDDDGYLIDKKNSTRLLSIDQKEIKFENLAGMTPGSIHLYDSDISSIIRLVENTYKKVR